MGEKKGTILCVDDEPSILRSLKWLLQKEFDVTTAGSGAEALALLRNSDFDVIVSDQRMPGMTGVELLREACRMAPRAIRILLTGYSDLDAVTRSVNESEIFRFVNKPWHVDELPQIIAEAARIAREHPAPAPIIASEVDAPAPAAAAAETLLVIDEDETVPEAVRQTLPAHAEVVHASSLTEAIDALASNSGIGLVVSDTRVGDVDATRLLKLLKERCPDVVTVAFSDQMDAQEIISLINHGQVYRFIQKPFRPGYLRLVLGSALQKRRQLRDSPGFARRHAVRPVGSEVREAFAGELQRLAACSGPARAANDERGASWLQRVTSGFRLIFG